MPKRTDSQSSVVARAAQSAGRTRVKAVVNIGRVELEMLRNKPAIRTIEPLARFQVSSTLLARTLPWQARPGYFDCALHWVQVYRQTIAHAPVSHQWPNHIL